MLLQTLNLALYFCIRFIHIEADLRNITAKLLRPSPKTHSMRRIQQVYTTLREQSWMGYAKIATIGGFCDLDIVLIKATSPDDLPLPERYIRELLKIFFFSPASFRAFSMSFSRRFSRTRCWRVALKCLILVHRLLRSLPEEDGPFRSDLMWSKSNGLISLYPCRFRDNSSTCSEDYYTDFIHRYARLLDEALDCYSLDGSSMDTTDESSLSNNFSDKIKEVGRILEVLPQLQSLIDRAMECKPTGSACRNLLVKNAMKHILRDSFVCYRAFRHDVIFLLDNLYQMQYRCCISALGIYKTAANQAGHLSEFYEGCKEMGLCGSYEYPSVDRIPQIHVRALECFLNGMWQLTESSPSTSSSRPSTFSPTEDEGSAGKQLALVKKAVISTEWERFEDEDEEEALIQLDMNDNVSWEVLLEASASVPRWCDYGYQYQYRSIYSNVNEEDSGGWKMQVYNQNSSFNPFYQNMPN